MSVIAKMQIKNISDFAHGRLVELTCVCENDLMAAYADSEEDRLFTKYSPWGEVKVNQPTNYVLGQSGDKFYVMLGRAEEISDFGFRRAVAFCPARIVSLTDFGDGYARRVEICDGHRKAKAEGIDSFNWKMSVDNPPATAQFKPSVDDYWVAFYPAKDGLDRNAAISAFHGPGPQTEGAVADEEAVA